MWSAGHSGTYESRFPIDPLPDLVRIFAVGGICRRRCREEGSAVGTLAEFIAYAKARPGALNPGTSGVGSPVHLVAVAARCSRRT